MRMNQPDVDVIRTAAYEVFGADAVVRLFGSRTDDQKRGGDIDIHIEAAPHLATFANRIKLDGLIWRRLEEERKIDIVVAVKDGPRRLIDTAAIRTGIIL